MAEDPSFANFPQFDPSDIFLNFPEGELPLLDGITSDLGLDDIDFDFSVDDLLPPSYNENDNAGSGSKFTTSSNSNLGSNPALLESGNSSAASGVVVVCQEDSRLKRKMDDDDSPSPIPRLNPSPNSNCNPSPRDFKIRRSKEVSTPSAGTEEDEKRKAKNRESARLARLRKKHYVEELEEKVEILTRKLSFVTAENDRLRRQLNGGGGGRVSLSSEYAIRSNGIPHPRASLSSEYAIRSNGIPHTRGELLCSEYEKKPEEKKSEKKKDEKKKGEYKMCMPYYCGRAPLIVEELEEKVKGLEEKVKILNRKLSLSTAENNRLRRQLNWNGAGYEKKREEKKYEHRKLSYSHDA